MKIKNSILTWTNHNKTTTKPKSILNLLSCYFHLYLAIRLHVRTHQTISTALRLQLTNILNDATIVKRSAKHAHTLTHTGECNYKLTNHLLFCLFYFTNEHVLGATLHSSLAVYDCLVHCFGFMFCASQWLLWTQTWIGWKLVRFSYTCAFA